MQEDNISIEPPTGHRRFTGKRLIGALVIILLLAISAVYIAGTFHSGHEPADGASAGAKYTCGMHPSIISDKPGDCPICGMALTKIESAPPASGQPKQPAAAKNEFDDLFDEPTTTTQGSGNERQILFYRNPMDPMVISPTPAKDEMGMDYVPVYEDETKGGGADIDLPEGYATVQVGMERVRMAGIRSAPAVRETISHPVRAVGIVVPDETRVRRVQAKIEAMGLVEVLLPF